jgi:NADH:ubiquinone oxidoreductase subunit C
MSSPAQPPTPPRPPPVRGPVPTGAAPPQPAPSAPPPQPELPARTKDLRDKILQRLPGAKLEYARPRRIKVTVPPSSMKEAASVLRDELGFDHISMVGGTDYPSTKEIEVIYFVGSPTSPAQADLVVLLAERVPRDSPSAPSLCGVWPGAEYHERETFEMLGVSFVGHPDLRRLLLPEDWNDIPPLRKDYTSPGR